MPRLYVTPPCSELLTSIPIDGCYHKLFEITLDKPLVSGSWIEAAAELQPTNDMAQQVGFFSKIVLQDATKTTESGALMLTRSNGGNATHDSDHHHQITKTGWVPVPDSKLACTKVQVWIKAVWTSAMDGKVSCPIDVGYGQLCVKQWAPSDLD
jgi:hypothetical protein